MNYWHTAIATFGMGDFVTTVLGLSLTGVYEAHPAAHAILGEIGYLGIILAKVVVFALIFLIGRLMPEGTGKAGPITLTVVGSIICLWNSYVITMALL